MLHVFQLFLCIGGVIKFIPHTGVTLPLISYGGSSILSTIIVFAVIQGLYLLKQKEVKEIEEKRRESEQRQWNDQQTRVYKKASLDDTVVNVRKDPSDDFDLLSDDGMMDYVQGVDDVDHFDFDEKDIEHYRKVNEQEAAERQTQERRALEKQRTAQKQQCETKKSDEQPQGKRQNKQAAKAVADEVPVKKTNTKKKNAAEEKMKRRILMIELRRELSERNARTKRRRITYVMMLLFFRNDRLLIYFDGVTRRSY